MNTEEISIYSEQVEELVAIGAAIASNCQSCFNFHYKKALNLGVSGDDILCAVETASSIKNVPAKKILTYARTKLMSGIPHHNDLDTDTCC